MELSNRQWYARGLKAGVPIGLGYLAVEDGKVAGVFAQLPEQYHQCDIEDWGDCLILQAPADMHVHGPQYAMMGLGLDKPLLEWLQSYAFPTEQRFADLGFAREVCDKVLFMADGVIEEEGGPEQIFVNPRNAKTREFLSRFRNTTV